MFIILFGIHKHSSIYIYIYQIHHFASATPPQLSGWRRKQRVCIFCDYLSNACSQPASVGLLATHAVFYPNNMIIAVHMHKASSANLTIFLRWLWSILKDIANLTLSPADVKLVLYFCQGTLLL